MAGASDRIRREQNGLAWLAWHIEALHRSKRMPKLENMMVADRRRRRQTPEEMKAVLRMWLAG